MTFLYKIAHDKRQAKNIIIFMHFHMMDDNNLNGVTNSGNSSSEDRVMVGEGEEMTECRMSANGSSSFEATVSN